jgi:hypothetical protein
MMAPSTIYTIGYGALLQWTTSNPFGRRARRPGDSVLRSFRCQPALDYARDPAPYRRPIG